MAVLTWILLAAAAVGTEPQPSSDAFESNGLPWVGIGSDVQVEQGVMRMVMVWGTSGAPCHGRLTLQAPHGLKINSADTSVSVNIERMPRAKHQLVRCLEEGGHRLSAVLRTTSPEGMTIFASNAMDVVCSDGAIETRSPDHSMRFWGVKEGQHFELLNGWWVPVDGIGPLPKVRFPGEGTPARAVEPLDSPCTTDTSRTDDISFQLVIDARGEVIAAKPFGGHEQGVLRAARRVIANAKFEPARVGGRVVADAIYVHFDVCPEAAR